MASTRQTRRLRHALLGLVLLACAAGLAALAAAQATPPTVSFTPAAGTFVGSETVTLSARADAEIHYTLDGTLPTAQSPVYQGPLTLERSTRLRALAISGRDAARRDRPRDGAGGAAADAPNAGPVATEIYLRVDPEARNLASHLPIVLIHMFEVGPLPAYGTEHMPAAALVMEPVAGTTRLVGRAATLDARVGIHVRGESSRRFPKKQYALELRGDDGDADSARPLLGLPAGADWVLSDAVGYDRSLIRNALAFALSNRIGRYAPRTRFVEVFMVDDGGDVRAGSALGLFTVVERIRRDDDRVGVSRLPESAVSPEAVSGGFILRTDKGPADFYAGGRRLQFVYPDADDMRRPQRAPQLDFIRTFIDDLGQALSAADFRHPATGQHYSTFIDVDAWIDHHIINTLSKNVDGLRFSAYFHKDRGGLLVAGPLWDFDRSFGTPYDPRAVEPEEWSATWSDATSYFTEGWSRYLFRDPAFRSRYRERFLALLDGEFSVQNIERLVDTLTSEVGDAASRNFRRWPQTPPKDDSYAAEIALLKDFVRRRAAWIRTQLATNF